MVHLMRGDGFQCVEAANGVEALDAARDGIRARSCSATCECRRWTASSCCDECEHISGRRRGHDHRRRRRRDRGELSGDRRDGLPHQAVPARRGPRARRQALEKRRLILENREYQRAPRGAGRGAGAPARGAVPRERAVARRGARAQGPVHARPLGAREPLLSRSLARTLGLDDDDRCARSSWADTCTTSARSACARRC